MVSGYDDHGNVRPSKRVEHGVRFLDDLRRDAAAKEEVAAVYDQIGFVGNGMVQHALEIGKEVGSSPSPMNTRAYGIVESQVRVRSKNDTDFLASRLHDGFKLHNSQNKNKSLSDSWDSMIQRSCPLK